MLIREQLITVQIILLQNMLILSSNQIQLNYNFFFFKHV